MPFPFLALAALTAGTAAYSAKQQRKAQRRAEEQAQTRALIEGSAPNIANVQEVVPEDTVYFSDDFSSFQDFSGFQKQHFQTHFQQSHN